MKKEIKILLLIFLLALFLRIIKLGTFPYGFHADEVRVAWNALSLLKTGHDDKGNLLPLYYNSFGDYRPTGIFYTVIPSLILFGRNEFAVRFPSALIGALSIVPLYLFVAELSKNKKLGFASSFLLTISPWHVDVSRATAEAVIAAFLTLWALYFFIRLINTNNKKFIVYSSLFTILSYFFYHSTRVVTPLFFAAVALYFRNFKKLILYTVAGTFLLTFLFSLNPNSVGRLNQVSIPGDIDVKYEISQAGDIVNNKFVIYIKRFINEYAKYFGADFLLGYSAKPYRYTTPGIGILTFSEGILFILGLIQIAKKKQNSLPFLLLLVSPLPAALTTEDSPNLMRSFYMIFFVVIISAYGLNFLLEIKKHHKLTKFSTFTLLLFNFAFFAYMYFWHSYIHRPFLANADMDNSSYRNIGTKEMALRLDGLAGKYEKIIVTGDPDNIYPWYAFFTGKDPATFNKNPKQFDNIYFSDLRCPSDDSFVEPNPDNLLVIDMWECAPESKIHDGLPIKILEKTYRPDKSRVFTLVTRSDAYFLQKKNK